MALTLMPNLIFSGLGSPRERLATTFFASTERRPLRRVLGEHSGRFLSILGGLWGSWKASISHEIEFVGRLFFESVFKVISGAGHSRAAGGRWQWCSGWGGDPFGIPGEGFRRKISYA